MVNFQGDVSFVTLGLLQLGQVLGAGDLQCGEGERCWVNLSVPPLNTPVSHGHGHTQAHRCMATVLAPLHPYSGEELWAGSW